MEKKLKPTIEDVAKYCGVSVSTVSRVINKSSPVSQELNTKVKKAIKELGFQPRRWTARFKPGKIGLIIPNILNPSFAEVINGAQEEADRQGLNLAIFNATENSELQEQHLSQLKKWSLDGIIVLGTKIPPEMLVKFYEQENIPIIISRAIEIPQLSCIMIDYATATSQAIKYLLSLNHKRIACISGLPEWDSSKVILESVQRTLSEAGLTLPSELYRWCFPNIEEGAQIANNFLNLPAEQRPTAIMAFNDLTAIGALYAAQAQGLSIPHDISVMGFGDIALAAYTSPPLTTISQPTYHIGRLSVKKLSELMKKRTTVNGGFTLLKCSLIVRESTGPYPA
jgi:DNA-binding LacI/PurR family transcriptional regulator